MSQTPRSEEVCPVCGGRQSACNVLGHRPPEDKTVWQKPPSAAAETCGAPAIGGRCTLPAGHNMGNLDIPQNHRAAETPAGSETPRTDAAECIAYTAWRKNENWMASGRYILSDFARTLESDLAAERQLRHERIAHWAEQFQNAMTRSDKAEARVAELEKALEDVLTKIPAIVLGEMPMATECAPGVYLNGGTRQYPGFQAAVASARAALARPAKGGQG